MNFQDTIKDVNSFYTQYDKTIATVNALFDAIDANAGQETSNELYQIITCLEELWCTNSNIKKNNNEVVVDEKFSSFTKRFDGPFESEHAILDLCKEIQTYFHNYSAVDAKPVVHCESDEVISRLFCLVKNIKSKELSFTITRILYELVTDDLLVRCGIAKLYDWNYGTDAYSLLSVEQQLVILLNQSIMIDRLHSGQHLLKLYLKRLNKTLDSFDNLNWFVYYVAGFLNFKIHNYRESKKYFSQVEKNNYLQTSSTKNKKRYFHAVLLIAYGYEYAGEFSRAIEKIVMSVDDLYKLLESVETKNIGKDDFLIDFLNQLVKKASEKSLFSMFFNGYTITHNITDCDEIEQYDIQVEILHALAHCVNEYSIQNHSVNQEHCSRLLHFARALMAFIAKENKEYWTCYATIHGEYKDYDIALKELCDASSKICEKGGKIKESLAAEIAFYQYYFGQIIHKQIDDEKERFSSYCKKYSDDDAFCHLQIFEFRRLLRDYVSEMFDYLRKNSRKKNRIEKLPSTETIRGAYESICRLHPSVHMNVNIRAELRLMQRIYGIINNLNNYLINPSNYNSKMLVNSCKRFCYTKKELGLSDNANYPICKTTSFLPMEVHQTLFGDYGVVHCLNITDSIFLLAPISGVVVYQYQTGTIDNLFDVDKLFDAKPEFAKKGISYFDTRTIITDYHNVVFEDRQVQISNADMNELTKNGVTDIYLWNSNVPSRLLQTNKNGFFTRRLTNSVCFQNSIETVVKEAQKEHIPCYKMYSHSCEIYSVTLPWLEFINEDDSNSSFLVYKRTSNNTIEYIVLSGNFYDINDRCCVIHSLLTPIEVRQNLLTERTPEEFKEVNSSEEIEKIKKSIMDKYNLLIKIEGEISTKENYLDEYEEIEYRNNVEGLKNKKAETIRIIKLSLKQLSRLMLQEDYILFVTGHFDAKYYNLFELDD